MSKQDEARSRLREAVREEITRSIEETGEARAGAIAQVVVSDHSELVKEIGLELAAVAIRKMASDELKSWSTMASEKENGQLHLPGISDKTADELPPTITVPSADGDTRHVAITRCTVGQFRSYEKMLQKQIANDRSRLRPVHEVVQKLKAPADDMNMVDALAKLAEKEPAE